MHTIKNQKTFCVTCAFSWQKRVLSIVIWIFAVGQIAFAESFPDRPTVAEMDETVRLGTECVKGVNERCWATQSSTNPVRYRVAPFTNNAEFYLDQSLMGSMAVKIRSLVPWYVNINTVSNGSPNIASLTVTGVWEKLAIGDHTNKFTRIPAVGTNVAIYGDDPWQIYIQDLEERYKVLNVLKMTKKEMFGPPHQQIPIAHYVRYAGYFSYGISYPAVYAATIADTPSYGEDFTSVAIAIVFEARFAEEPYMTNWTEGTISQWTFRFPELAINTQIESLVTAYLYTVAPNAGEPSNRFNDNGFGFQENKYCSFSTNGIGGTNNYALFDPAIFNPDSGDGPLPEEDITIATGFMGTYPFWIINWHFNYCANKYW